MRYIRTIIKLVTLVILFPTNNVAQADPSTMTVEVKAFRDLKYGMFIHFGMSTYDGEELSDGTTPVEMYNPDKLDVEQWVMTAKNAGMKYIVLTAKHVSGFCIWDSKVQWEGEEFSYDVASSPATTDVVAEFMEACEKHDMVPGIYYCTMDRRHSNQKISWTPSLPYISEEYFQLMKDHLTELHTLYPSIEIQWIDIPRHLTYEQRDTLYNLVRNLNDDCLVMYNYGKESADISGAYSISEAMKVTWPTDIFNSEVTTIKYPFQLQQEYNGTIYDLAYEHCISLVEKWFWKPGETPKSLSTLTSVWNQTNNLNGNLLLNVPPDKSGLIPQASIERLNELKSELFDTGTVTSDNVSIHETGPEKIKQAIPNPFSSYTKIKYSVAKPGKVQINIYDLSGQKIETIKNEVQTTGHHEIIWRPSNLPEGIYICKLFINETIDQKILILNNR